MHQISCNNRIQAMREGLQLADTVEKLDNLDAWFFRGKSNYAELNLQVGSRV